MKKILAVLVIIFSLFNANGVTVLAAPPQEEVDQVLAEIGWSNEDLKSYLEYYELSLVEFETIEDLRGFLGTPITDENLSEMLATYNLTREELDTLLAGFGETVDDYWFIEDLDVSVDFYVNHDQNMKDSEEFLATIGLTEEEVDTLFNHLMALDQTELEQRMEEVATRLEPYLLMDFEEELTDAQIEEFTAVWEDMLNLLQLNPKFYLVNSAGDRTVVSYRELVNIENLYGNSLAIELYNTQGTLLLDMQLSEEMMSSDYIFNAANELTNVGDLAGELTELKHDQLPKTASPYGINMVMGLVAMLAGLVLYLATRKQKCV